MLRIGLIIAAVAVVLDQASKVWVLEVLQLSPPGCFEISGLCRSIELSDRFDITMLWNKGVSFGMLTADSDLARWGLVLLQGGIAALFAWWLRTAKSWLTVWSLSLVIGGAIGNVIDRVRFGGVVDFLDFRGLGFPWIFNVADTAINVGAGLLILDFILRREPKPEPAPAKSPNAASKDAAS